MAGRRVTVKAVEKRVTAQEPGIAITLAQALLKSDKMDRVIRDAVMLGVAAIQPFTSARTEVPRAAVGSRQDRWDRTVIASVKQCGRAVVPAVHPTLALSELLNAERDALCLMFVDRWNSSVGGRRELRLIPEPRNARAREGHHSHRPRGRLGASGNQRRGGGRRDAGDAGPARAARRRRGRAGDRGAAIRLERLSPVAEAPRTATRLPDRPAPASETVRAPVSRWIRSPSRR